MLERGLSRNGGRTAPFSTRPRSRAEQARSARWRGVHGAVGWLISYAAWVMAIRLLVLTFITYFVMTGTASRPARFEDISEAFGSNELTLVGLAAVAFLVLLRFLNPITSTRTEEIFTPQRIEKSFLPGFFHGALVASGLILALLLSGLYRYLGFIVQFEDAHINLPSIVMRALAVAGWVYCEEFIFRQKLQNHLAALPISLSSDPARSARLARLAAVLVTAIAYCGVKRLQFDLGWMHMLTLFLASIALSVRALKDNEFAGGAGFFAATLIVFHPILSLPIFGNEFSGIVLVKHQAAMDIVEDQAATARFFGGGAGGPLGSFAFQLLLILDIARGIIQMKRNR